MCLIGRPYELKDIPKAQAVIAYRTNRSSSFTREAPQFGQPYKKGVVYRANRRPRLKGRTGFWCFRNRTNVRMYFSARQFRTIIRVKLWGKVVEHSTGYRGEFMERVS